MTPSLFYALLKSEDAKRLSQKPIFLIE
ncbi:hypothetical protein SOR_1227 [Streptococcus oralis Uo5]|uniref:Uncharacterized protein n=1 Tax=Streptococcus oralis (strain Uo5) TaxID=927666 RepID=F2QE16_STROU|nr:hypothetical protein SOR_1227 [Streptococcus oralis Uo5]